MGLKSAFEVSLSPFMQKPDMEHKRRYCDVSLR